jgi:predicted Co/Zn/Cd cation transporter (cation efflux family)
MDWDFDNLLWPTVYILQVVAVVFFIWAMTRRQSKKRRDSWIELMAVAAFCFFASIIMLLVNSFGFHLDFTARLGVVSVILCLYAYYSYKRNKNR